MLTINSVEVTFVLYKESEDTPGTYVVDQRETVSLSKKYIDRYLHDDAFLSHLGRGGVFWELCPRKDPDEMDEISTIKVHFEKDGESYADLFAYDPHFSECRVFCEAGHTDYFLIKDEFDDKTIKNLKSIVYEAVEDLKVLATA